MNELYIHHIYFIFLYLTYFSFSIMFQTLTIKNSLKYLKHLNVDVEIPEWIFF